MSQAPDSVPLHVADSGGGRRDRGAHGRGTGGSHRFRTPHVGGVPHGQRLRSQRPRRRPGRSARRARLGARAQCPRPGGRPAAAARSAAGAGPGGLPEAARGADQRAAGTVRWRGGPVRGAPVLPLRQRDPAVRGPLRHAAPDQLRDTAAGGGPAAHRGRSAPAALPGGARDPAHRRADRHRPAGQPGRGAAGQQGPVDRRGRDVRGTGLTGGAAGDVRGGEPARRQGRRVDEPARGPPAQPVRAVRAQRPAADRRADPVPDLHRAGLRRVRGLLHSPVRAGADAHPGQAGPALRVPGRAAAGRRPFR